MSGGLNTDQKYGMCSILGFTIQIPVAFARAVLGIKIKRDFEIKVETIKGLQKKYDIIDWIEQVEILIFIAPLHEKNIYSKE